MSLNKNALIRYKTIDACLQNRFRKWTLEDLIEACSEALYEYEGIRDGVSRRTVQLDIQLMRSDKLGYNAPIVVIDKKYYRYEDPQYSITDIPLTGQDLDRLTEVASMLRQFKGFSHFREVDDMVSRLQHKVFSGRQAQKVVIDFEKNEHLVGLEHIDPLFQAIIGRKVLYIQYQSFKAREAQEFEFHPHLLKEYRNRWFVLGGSGRPSDASRMDSDISSNLGKSLESGLAHHMDRTRHGTDRSRPVPAMLALDRIRAITSAPAIPYFEIPGLDASYFEPLIGVTRNANQRPVTITFWVDAETTPYVRTKPLHPSQQWVEDRGRGAVFSIQVIPNFELERELLGFGASLEVLAPERLRKRMKDILGWAVGRYTRE